jgi:hypothetical protein
MKAGGEGNGQNHSQHSANGTANQNDQQNSGGIQIGGLALNPGSENPSFNELNEKIDSAWPE